MSLLGTTPWHSRPPGRMQQNWGKATVIAGAAQSLGATLLASIAQDEAHPGGGSPGLPCIWSILAHPQDESTLPASFLQRFPDGASPAHLQPSQDAPSSHKANGARKLFKPFLGQEHVGVISWDILASPRRCLPAGTAAQPWWFSLSA